MLSHKEKHSFDFQLTQQQTKITYLTSQISSRTTLLVMVLLFSLVIITTLTLKAQDTFSQIRELNKDSLVIEKVNTYLEEMLALENFSGSILIARDSTILIEKSIGMANYEFLIPNSSNTKFRIASLSKAFAAALVLQQVEKGRIKLDGKISDYLPYYPQKTGKIITIHQLLTHSSGLVHYEGIKDFYPKYGQQQFYYKDYLKLFWDLPLLFEPGTSHSYSSLGYFVLGAILQEVTGKTYQTLLKENILTPLSLSNTGVDIQTNILPNRASGYTSKDYTLYNAIYYDMSKSMATGDLYSTPKDLLAWSLALNTNSVLSEKYRKLLFSPYINGYAYAWSIKRYTSTDKNNNSNTEGKKKEDIICATHSGTTRGFESYLNKFLNYGYTIVILSNISGIKVSKINDEITKIIIGGY